MAGQTFISGEMPTVGIVTKGKEDFNPVAACQVIVGLVEKAVAQSGAHQHRNKHIDKQRLQILVVDMLPLEHARHDDVAQQECKQKTQRVPPHTEGADVEDDRVYIPDDIV